eukprot:scaffold95393_cov30-Prasinocladus_malaysianus.AAC.1
MAAYIHIATHLWVEKVGRADPESPGGDHRLKPVLAGHQLAVLAGSDAERHHRLQLCRRLDRASQHQHLGAGRAQPRVDGVLDSRDQDGLHSLVVVDASAVLGKLRHVVRVETEQCVAASENGSVGRDDEHRRARAILCDGGCRRAVARDDDDKAERHVDAVLGR